MSDIFFCVVYDIIIFVGAVIELYMFNTINSFFFLSSLINLFMFTLIRPVNVRKHITTYIIL